MKSGCPTPMHCHRHPRCQDGCEDPEAVRNYLASLGKRAMKIEDIYGPVITAGPYPVQGSDGRFAGRTPSFNYYRDTRYWRMSRIDYLTGLTI